MEKQSKEIVRLATGWSGQEFLTTMERLVDISSSSNRVSAELESETIEKATNETDSYSGELASVISIEEVQQFRKEPYMGFNAKKLHAIFEEYGHIRDIADILAGHGLCQQETLIGLYGLYRHDVSFVESLLKRWQKLPEGLLHQIEKEHQLKPLHQSENTSTTAHRQKR